MFWLMVAAVAIQAVTLGLFLCVFLRGLKVADKVQQYEDFFVDLLRPQGDKPSKLVEFIDGVSVNIATRIVSSAEAAIRGSAGGAKRADNAEMIASNPLLGLMGGRLGKNPLVGSIIQALVNKIGSGVPAQDQGNQLTPGNGSVKFKL